MLRLPPLYLPIPAVTPRLCATEISHAAAAWLERFALGFDAEHRERLAAAEVGFMANALAPRGEPGPVQLIADFLMWNVCFDDEFCDEGPLSTRPVELTELVVQLQRALESPEIAFLPHNRYARALRNIRVRFGDYASPAECSRWAEAMRGWFLAEIWKSGNVSTGRLPSLSDFLLQRLASGGGLTFPIMVGVAEGHSIAPEHLEDRRIRALTEIAVLIGSSYTDLTSYARERHIKQGGYNLVDVLQREQHRTTDQAVTLAVTMLDRMMALFLRLRAQVESENLPGVSQYLTSLGNYIRAAIDWTMRSARYTHPFRSDRDPAFNPGGWRDTATIDPTPLNIPSIAWWWHHDPLRTNT